MLRQRWAGAGFLPPLQLRRETALRRRLCRGQAKECRNLLERACTGYVADAGLRAAERRYRIRSAGYGVECTLRSITRTCWRELSCFDGRFAALAPKDPRHLPLDGDSKTAEDHVGIQMIQKKKSHRLLSLQDNQTPTLTRISWWPTCWEAARTQTSKRRRRTH